MEHVTERLEVTEDNCDVSKRERVATSRVNAEREDGRFDCRAQWTRHVAAKRICADEGRAIRLVGGESEVHSNAHEESEHGLGRVIDCGVSNLNSK